MLITLEFEFVVSALPFGTVCIGANMAPGSLLHRETHISSPNARAPLFTHRSDHVFQEPLAGRAEGPPTCQGHSV